jgi:hypothetical protein
MYNETDTFSVPDGEAELVFGASQVAFVVGASAVLALELRSRADVE